jgi:hypothetical protein
MHKFPISKYRRYEELPFEKFNEMKFSIYVIDFNWNYLFVNQFAKDNLKERTSDLIGKNMWDEFPEFRVDPVFKSLREKMDRKVACTFETTSPINSKRLYITGYPLEDCFYFSSSILPDRQEHLKRNP